MKDDKNVVTKFFLPKVGGTFMGSIDHWSQTEWSFRSRHAYCVEDERNRAPYFLSYI